MKTVKGHRAAVPGRGKSRLGGEGDSGGFTIIELMVGLIAASILTYAAMSLYTAQHKQLLVQDEIADMQGNLRSSAEMLATAIRKAGFNIPSSFTAIETHDTDPDTIVVTYDTGVLFGVELRFDMADAGDVIRCLQANDISGLKDGDWAYIYDPVADFGEFFLISRILTGPPRMEHSTWPLSRIYLVGSTIRKIARIKFYVDRPDSTHSNLIIQPYGTTPQIFAENIVNLNFRYYLSTGAIVTQPTNPADIRLVEIDIEGRTESPDPEFFSQYRTRNFTLRVNVRNLGLE